MAKDLRHWLDQIEQMEELRAVDGADWNLEMGAISALGAQKENNPALIFDKIKGYPEGFRVVTRSLSTRSRIEVTFGLEKSATNLDLVKAMRGKLPGWEKMLHQFPFEEVGTGPVLENIKSGQDVDLFEFPVPKWHEKDGGRYIGTGDAIITQDPETGEVNLGTYRIMVHDKKTAALHISPGKHGRIHYEKYHTLGKPCPVAMSFGHHPLMFGAGCMELLPGQEYPFVGAVTGQPVQVIREEITGLPIPAHSEIVAVGWVPPGETRVEGPFGEWTGYYASKEQKSPIAEIERIYHRNRPILLGTPPGLPPAENSLFEAVKNSVVLWNALDRSDVPDVKGVWMSEFGQQQFVIVSIKQRYHGHARQAAFAASQNRPAAYHGRYVIVVDDDIDPSEMNQVLWALSTRSDPEKDIDIIRRAWSTPLDTMIRKPADAYVNSRAVIDACKPYEWIKDFPEAIRIGPELAARVKKKWPDI